MTFDGSQLELIAEPEFEESRAGLIHGYNPPGPVSKAFISNDADVSGIMGPVRGGKSIASIVRGLVIAARQPVALTDGIKHCKIVCVADKYGNIWDKLIPTYREVWPEAFWGKIKGGKNGPADVEIYMKDWPNAGDPPIHLIYSFRAVGDETMLDSFIGGLQPTAIYLYEATFLPPKSLTKLAQRVGRWPPPAWLNPPRRHPDEEWKVWPKGCIWADFNAPNETHCLTSTPVSQI